VISLEYSIVHIVMTAATSRPRATDLRYFPYCYDTLRAKPLQSLHHSINDDFSSCRLALYPYEHFWWSSTAQESSKHMPPYRKLERSKEEEACV